MYWKIGDVYFYLNIFEYMPVYCFLPSGEIVEAHPSFYEAVSGGLDEVRKRVEMMQRRFNEESKVLKLELVLFTDALCHLMRVSRLLAMDRGSALLVGVGGSGKQSLSRLAAYIAGCFTFQVSGLGGSPWVGGGGRVLGSGGWRHGAAGVWEGKVCVYVCVGGSRLPQLLLTALTFPLLLQPDHGD